MPLRRLALLLAGGVLAINLILPLAPRRVAALAAHASTGSAAPSSQSATPLPGGCGHVTPPGEPVAPCCLSGFIYMDGQIIAGAEVVVQSSRGDQVTLFTQVYSGTETRPYYRLSLSAAPLNIQAGEAITITARYSSHERSMNYTVHPSAQQVDMVLARNQASDYISEGQIRGMAETGKFNGPDGIAVDGNGYIFVADGDNARIQVFRNNGTFIRQWGTFGTLPGQFNQPRHVAADASGNVYVADLNNHRIQKFSNNGVWLSSWSGNGKAQLLAPYGVAVDRSGYVYVADFDTGLIDKFRSDGVWIKSWAGQADLSDGRLDEPVDLAIDSQGNIYVADSDNPWVKKYRSDGTWLQTWDITTGDPVGIAVDNNDHVYVSTYDYIHTFTSDGVLISSRSNGANFLESMAVDVNDNIYVADVANNQIHKFTSIWAPLLTWGGGSSRLLSPMGVAFDASGNILVTDSANNRVQKLTATGEVLASWGIYGSGPGQFIGSQGIAVDSNGYIYVVDSSNNRIQKFDSTGKYNRQWGTQGSGPEQLSFPTWIAIDSSNNIYVADSGNYRIQKFDSNGTPITRWGSQGDTNLQFGNPKGIAIDSSDNVYVVDSWNDRVQKFDSNGGYITAWGSTGSANKQFSYPQGIGVDANDDIYVVDSDNNRIQKFTSTGGWLATWGIQGSGIGQVYGPYGIAVNNAGIVYIADSWNNRVLAFHTMTYTQPIATISYLSALSLGATDTLIASGIGQDSDETPGVIAYRWILDANKALGTSAALTIAAGILGPGAHHLAFQVRDGEGAWSDPIGADIYVAPPPQAQWTMLLYLAGDYLDRGKQLEDFTATLNVLRQSFRNPYVRIAVQLDGPANGDTRRLLITPGTANAPPEVTDISYGERAMDDPNVLADFVRWGQSSFPAPHYYLAIADHGQGVQGIAWDSTTDPNDGAYLTVKELGQALSAPGVAPVDILHLDACSMDMLEVAYEVRQRARIVIASQYLGWSYFDYYQYQSAMGLTTTPYDVARGIVARYAAHAQADQYPYTISALDLGRAEPTLTAVDALAAELKALVSNNPSSRTLLDSIRSNSQKFESNGDFVSNDLDLYVDLADWTSKVLVGVSSPAVKTRAAALITELTGAQPFILANMSQSNRLPPQYAGGAYIDLSNAHGLSIFYPRRQNTQEFKSYINNALFSFTSASRWPDFLIAGVGALQPGPLDPLPGPLPPLTPSQRVFLPLIIR